jgi:hypothetical protein
VQSPNKNRPTNASPALNIHGVENHGVKVAEFILKSNVVKKQDNELL